MKYNIVIVNPDQMRWDYISPNGHPFIETRHLNRLAAIGTNFNQAFCACPMCGPSRTSAVTGRYPSEHGVRDYGGTMHPDHPNLFEELRKAGYHRALFGKDHVTFENSIGVHYDEGEDICIGNMDHHPDYTQSWSSGQLAADCEWNLTERLTTAGLDYIERRSRTGQPFFLTLNYQDPHPYFAAPEPYDTLFSPDQFELPPNFRREPAADEPRRLDVWREHSHSRDAGEEDFKKAMAMYCGQIRYVDDQLGRVLDKLEELSLLESTIVLFWSDHGEFLGDYGVTHKMAAYYDCLVRIPMILRDPSGRIPTGTNRHIVEAMDIFATILDLCGISQPAGSRAYSLLTENYTPRADAYAEGGLLIPPVDDPIPGLKLRAPSQPTQFGPGAMLRTERWKLCVHGYDKWELYDLENDPHETNNLYHNPAYASVACDLHVRLTQRMLCHGQAPEHLPTPVVRSIDSNGLPIWDKATSAVIQSAGMLPGIQADCFS